MRNGIERTLAGIDAARLWELAADVESYPAFLPMCLAARVRRRDGDRLDVDNLFGVGPLRLRFRTRARFDPPRAIDITSSDGPYKHLRIAWRFTPVDGGGCRVAFSIEQTFRHRWIARLAAPLSTHIEQDVLAAFEKRAREVCG